MRKVLVRIHKKNNGKYVHREEDIKQNILCLKLLCPQFLYMARLSFPQHNFLTIYMPLDTTKYLGKTLIDIACVESLIGKDY